MATNHVVLMSYPARGHLNPFMSLCHLLSSRSNAATTIFTVVVTEEWLGLIGSDPKPDNVRFATIPNVIPSEHGRGSDLIGFITAVNTKIETPFEELLDRLEPPVKLIIGDAFLSWSIDVANRRNIPVAAYWPMSASMFTLWYHVDLLDQHRHICVDVSEKGEEWIDYIPGLSPVKLVNLPQISQEERDLAPNLASMMKKAEYLLLPAVHELEPEAVNTLKSRLQIPVYTLGPNIPHPQIQTNKPVYMKWLDSKPTESVLYISLGSFLSVSSSQLDEIAAGLKQSGVNFMWVAKGETKLFDKSFGDEGLVVEWCDQFRVLSHSSIGGFWSHCGWNSVKESVFWGVPMLTFPIFADQLLNSKMVVDDWGNGWRVKEVSRNGLVKREEIAEVVRRFMNLTSAERREMMDRVKELQDVSRKSVEEGGSAIKDMDMFIKNNMV